MANQNTTCEKCGREVHETMTVWNAGKSSAKVDFYVDYYKLEPAGEYGGNGMIPYGIVCVDCYPEHVKKRDKKKP